jgi:hypothetical protein
VLAGNVHLGGILPAIAGTLVPATAFTGVTQPLGKRLALAVAFGGAVRASRHANFHYRVVGRDRLLWTRRASGGARFARRSLERAIRATYPQLGPVQFEHFWAADMGTAVHGMPQIGEAERGVWLASAFGAQGLNTSAMAGSLIARAIVDRDDSWRRFVPFELVWAGGRGGRSVARATAWWWRQSDAALSLAARRREAFRLKRDAKKSAGRDSAGQGDAEGNLFGSLGSKLRDTGLLASKIVTDRIQGGGRLASRIPFPSGYDPIATVKRVLKNSFAADDRPIEAPEAVPSDGAEAPRPVAWKRKRGTATPD